LSLQRDGTVLARQAAPSTYQWNPVCEQGLRIVIPRGNWTDLIWFQVSGDPSSLELHIFFQSLPTDKLAAANALVASNRAEGVPAGPPG
jgi:hypothetical protein